MSIGIRRMLALAGALAWAIVYSSCSGSARPVATDLAISPGEVSLQQGGAQHFSVVVSPPSGTADAVSWSVDEPGGGAVTSSGDYTAPMTAGLFHVRARLLANPQVTAAAAVTVQPAPGSPTIGTFTASPAAVAAGQSSRLAWTVLGATAISLSPDAGPLSLADSGATVRPATSTVYTLTASNAQGSVSASVTIEVIAAVLIQSFGAAPAQIPEGATTTLSWRVANAAALAISPRVGSLAGPLGSGSLDSGSVDVAPATSTTYTLTASNLAGTSTAQATVVVVPLPTVRVFSATPGSVGLGQGAQLTWDVAGAATVAIGDDRGGATSTVSATGTLPVAPVVTTVYTLTASSLAGSVLRQAAVTVVPPAQISSFGAAPTTIGAGASSTLTWTVTGVVDALTVTDDRSSATTTVAATSSLIVSPPQTTVYTLTARNLAGSVARQATVTVVPLPQIAQLQASPSTIGSGFSSTLSWVTAGSIDLLSLYSSATGATSTVTGLTSLGVSPTQTAIYTLTARNLAGSVSLQVAVTVVQRAQITAFQASPATIGSGASSTLSWTITGPVASLTLSATGTSVDVTGLSNASVAPTGTTLYTLTATNAAGSALAQTSVTVVQKPVIASFSASPSTIGVGATTTLSWSVTGATSLTISPGVGSVTGTSLLLSPAGTTSYLLTASNSGGSSSASTTVTVAGSFVTPSPITGDVVISMDSSSGTRSVSPYIFGSLRGTGYAAIATSWRSGGNRLTGYNWENGYSNAGSDYGPYSNDTFMAGDGTPASDLRTHVDGVYGRTGTWASAALLTIPTIGYVAGPWTGNSTPQTSPDVLTLAPPLVTGGQAWKTSLPNRAGDAAHALATSTPNRGDAFVYQDDFLAWFRQGWTGHDTSPTAPIFIALDNEPDLWGTTHMEIRGKPPAQHVQVGYDELVSNNVTYANVVKAMLGQGAKVFAPVLSGWMGLVSNGNVDAAGNGIAPPTGYSWYVGYYLQKMSDASTAAGRRLLDAVDLHWYPEASSAAGRIVGNDGLAQDAAMIVAREQAPRSLWDPAYLENSWIQYWDVNIPGCTWGGNAANCSIKLLPTLKSMIGSYYPGTGIAVTEWSYGREMDVSNAVASADALGIFAREGVYAAYAWPMSSGDGCLTSAMRAYLSYDGAGSHFGDTFLPTSVADPNRPVDTYMSGAARGDGTTVPTQTLERVTAYGSFDASAHGRAVIVAINKDLSATINAGLSIRHDALFTKAQLFRVTGTNGGAGGCTGPVRLADVPIASVNAFNAALPPQSVSVFVLLP